jgi:hypothetical protein
LLLASVSAAVAIAACGGEAAQGSGPQVPGAPTATTEPKGSPTSSPTSAPTGAPTGKPGSPAFSGPMTNIEATKMAADLQALGLDMKNLPPLEKLDPKVLRKVMGTFTRSLGVQCSGCHSGENFAAPTPMKHVAAKMWNEWVRGYTTGGQPIYCDSCHQGREKLLDKHDKKALSAWMEANFVKKLDRRDGKAVECATCHGEEFDPDFLEKWKK